MTDPHPLIREAQDRAERLCALAVDQTPAAYQSFITLIGQRRKVGGSRQAPVFATVRQPYLSVDGRVKWARDEHLRAGKRFDVQTEFVVEPTSGQLLARATLTSEIYGTVVAHARVFLGGDGVHESNPLETGETSAVGRALGMWGFGCYGTGIASADEVLRVAEAELVRLGQALGLRPGELALRRAQAPSDTDALTALAADVAARVGGDETTREALLAYAAGLGVDTRAYRRYLVARYQIADRETPEGALSETHLREERDRFVRRYQDAGVARGFREQCARLAGTAAD
jgi:hypothetical protein